MLSADREEIKEGELAVQHLVRELEGVLLWSAGSHPEQPRNAFQFGLERHEACEACLQVVAMFITEVERNVEGLDYLLCAEAGNVAKGGTSRKQVIWLLGRCRFIVTRG